jgi:hypothetical protein
MEEEQEIGPVGTFGEDMISNAILGAVMIVFMLLRDFCKRISHSECAYDAEHGGLKIRLPTWRPEQPNLEANNDSVL